MTPNMRPATRWIRRWLSRLIVASCLAAGIPASLDAAPQAAADCPLKPSLEPQDMPPDVCGGSAAPTTDPTDPLKYFDALAWQTFKMLVWPASQTRGEPDKDRSITDMDGSRTFETFKAEWEVFQPNAEPPLPWNTYPHIARTCENHPTIANGALVIDTFTEFGAVGEAAEYGPPTNVLVARNQRFVRYLAAYNQLEFNTIVTNRLYDAKVVAGITLPKPGEPIPNAAMTPDDSLTVKSAWIELPSDDQPNRHIDPSHFYTRGAWLRDPDPNNSTCRYAEVGLVGLHIVHKTPSRPQWVWSSFEHIDNVPEANEPLRKTHTFNNGDLTAPVGDQVPLDWRLPKPVARSHNVVRRQHIEDVTKQINADWQAMLRAAGSVWQYYKLVLTQWPSIPVYPNGDAQNASPAPPCRLSTGTATASVVLETFFQQPAVCTSTTTCMTCHNGARGADFVWSILMNRYAPSTMEGRPSPRIRALKTLREFVGGSNQ
jgi:hypothetical protein